MDDRFSPQPLGTPPTATAVDNVASEGVAVAGAGPLFEVVLKRSFQHSPAYVTEMLTRLFGHTPAQAACVVQHLEQKGEAVLAVTYQDDAERRRRLIHTFGPDPRLPQSTGAMWVLVRAALCS